MTNPTKTSPTPHVVGPAAPEYLDGVLTRVVRVREAIADGDRDDLAPVILAELEHDLASELEQYKAA
jgi:hypothetical protein